ncbi:MAG: HAMP domain-containing sensor histidine kinase [Porphyromonas sp.]|nr:HAMP domain-containing sensor histidine kinase [Porphyromonas sp.]
MDRRGIIWVIGIALNVVFVSLIGVQYLYYTRILTMRKEQTMQMAHLVLQDVAKDIEVRELVRYLNKELNSTLSPNNTLTEALRSLRTAPNRDRKVAITRPEREGQSDSVQPHLLFDSLAVSDNMLRAFIDNRETLDEYVLRNLYRVYSYDSIPQLVNPRLLRENLKYKLTEHGVDNPYMISLCSSGGRELFRYTDPRMRLRESSSSGVVIQRLFINRDYPNKVTPFLRLALDFEEDVDALWAIAWPGILITLIVLILGVFAMWLISRQLSFHSMRSDFINNMTHELKTPVSSILLSVEQMQRLPAPVGASPEDVAKRKRYLNIMEDEAQRLRMLIDKVLQIALYDKNQKNKLVNLTEISLDEIIFKAAKLFSVHAAKHGGELILEHTAENTWILGSETHMTNVLYNLLENAVKYRDESRALELVLRTSNNDAGELVIEVEDNGYGIPEEDTKRIFERFYRVHTGLKHNVKGHGLGLAYVQSIVKQFGGRIQASNKASGGLRMTLVLPTLGTDTNQN